MAVMAQVRPPVRARLPGGGNLPGLVDYRRPLCALSVPAHIHRYLKIDSFQERLEAFQAEFSDAADWTAKGHMVVVTGDRGFGKTSLIQRCAAWLEEQAEHPLPTGQLPGRIFGVDLSDEGGWSLEETIDERMHRTLRRITAKLGNELDLDARLRIEAHANPRDGFYDLGQELERKRAAAAPGIVLLVILQGYPKPAEVNDYYGLAVPGLIFFAEVYSEAYTNEIVGTRGEAGLLSESRRNSADPHHLALNTLKPGDARLLADWIRDTGAPWPILSGDAVTLIDDEFISLGVGMAALTKMTWGVQGIARAESVTTVTVTHVAKYFMRG